VLASRDGKPVQKEMVTISRGGKEVVKVSQERPAGTAPSAVRRIWAKAIDGSGSPSSDGRYLSFVDWDTGDLAVRELATGKNRRLTNKGSTLFSIWSPDCQQIAYRWNRSEIRLIRLDGSAPRVLYHNEQVYQVTPADWSPDG